MRCTVTGANGFLGSHLVDRLLADGHEVTALVRAGCDRRWLDEARVTLVMGALDDRRALTQAVAGAELVFHVAGVVAAADPRDYDRVNAQGTRVVAEACLEASPDLARFVLVSSLAAHGPAPAGRLIREDSPLAPINQYGRSKRRAEEVALALRPRLPLTIVRPSGIYGPRDRESLNLFTQAAHGLYLLVGLGQRMVNLCHVDDITRGIVQAALCPEARGHAFLLGHPRNLSLGEMGRTLVQAVHGGSGLPVWLPRSGVLAAGVLGSAWARVSGRRPLLSLDRVRMLTARNWAIDASRAEQVFGFRPELDLLEGARRTAAWYRKEKWL